MPRKSAKRMFLSLLLCLTCALAFLILPTFAQANDGIFPAAAAAKPFIDFDGRGFLLHGKREFIASGTMHYSRVPRALWRDRLLRIKRAGFNTIETYAFWNFHEMQEGKWNFAGDKDFNAYLKLIKELGMYALVRVGPYVCAEWDSGGYPVWLRFVPNMRVREDNAVFESYVDKWFDKIMPIVAANQIHKGGAVIMVQLENEHPQGWGTEMPNNYFRHLREKALALGLEVPYFFSGLHHGSDPAGNRDWDSKGRTNPWFTTEFWPGWYDLYGPLEADKLRGFTRGTWKILAYGGNGYNFYMLHGGTNFDTWNNDEVASNYDYGGAVGQTGDMRPIYFQFKRATQFARSFADVLEDSENATDQFKDMAAGTSLRVTARKSPAGTLIFLDNNTASPAPFQGMTLQPGEIAPLVRDYKLLPDVTLAETNARILGIARQGDMTTLVVYGYPQTDPQNALAERPELKFAIANGKKAAIMQGEGAFSNAEGNVAGQPLTLKPEFVSNRNSGYVQEYMFAVGGAKVRVLAMAAPVADQTWFVEAGSKSYVLAGFDYVGDVTDRDGKLHITGERLAAISVLSNTKAGNGLAYGAEDKPQSIAVSPPPAPVVAATLQVPALNNWKSRRADREAGMTYATNNWKTSEQPLQMGADGDTSAYAWYRTTAHAPKEGLYSLQFSDVGDWLAVFVNGERVDIPVETAHPSQRFETSISRHVNVPLKAGDNTVAVLTAHYGRNKLFNYLGPMDKVAAKGIAGPVTLSQQTNGRQLVKGWQWRPAIGIGANGVPAELTPEIPVDGAFWQVLKSLDQDVFDKRSGFAWFRATLPVVPGPHRKLTFANVDDNATVYLNGKKVGEHKGWGQPFAVNVDSAWREGGPNQLVVLVENTANTGGINGVTELQTVNPEGDVEITGWKMHGGIGRPQAIKDWQALKETLKTSAANDTKNAAVTTSAPISIPTFYRADFTAMPPAAIGPHPILRVTLDGLSRGFIWLNGHNLGRYPEKVPVKSLYLPECWLNRGKNRVVIYDEEGNKPTQVHLTFETDSSRIVTEYTAQ